MSVAGKLSRLTGVPTPRSVARSVQEPRTISRVCEARRAMHIAVSARQSVMSGQNCSGSTFEREAALFVPQSSMGTPSSRTRVDGMLKKSVAALALRDMTESAVQSFVEGLPLVRVPAFG